MLHLSCLPSNWHQSHSEKERDNQHVPWLDVPVEHSSHVQACDRLQSEHKWLWWHFELQDVSHAKCLCRWQLHLQATSTCMPEKTMLQCLLCTAPVVRQHCQGNCLQATANVPQFQRAPAKTCSLHRTKNVQITLDDIWHCLIYRVVDHEFIFNQLMVSNLQNLQPNLDNSWVMPQQSHNSSWQKIMNALTADAYKEK